MSAISIRDYEQRLAALAATTQPTPQAFDQALGLAKGLLSALRSWGTPPVSQPSLKIRAQSLKPHITDLPPTRPAHLVRPATSAKSSIPAGWNGVKAERSTVADVKSRKVKKAGFASLPETPEGYMSTRDIVRELERPYSWIFKAMTAETFPRPTMKRGQFNYWPAKVVMQWKADHPTPQSRRVPQPPDQRLEPQPKSTLTIDQIMEMTGYSNAWIRQRMRDEGPGLRPFPKPYRRWGHSMLYDEATVKEWLLWRADPANGFTTRKPLGTA